MTLWRVAWYLVIDSTITSNRRSTHSAYQSRPSSPPQWSPHRTASQQILTVSTCSQSADAHSQQMLTGSTCSQSADAAPSEQAASRYPERTGHAQRACVDSQLESYYYLKKLRRGGRNTRSQWRPLGFPRCGAALQHP